MLNVCLLSRYLSLVEEICYMLIVCVLSLVEETCNMLNVCLLSRSQPRRRDLLYVNCLCVVPSRRDL